MDQLAAHSNPHRPLLKVQRLTVEFGTPAHPLVAVDHVGFTVAPGETVCLVGESGSGKTVTALSLLRLDEFTRARIVGGDIEFDGQSLLSLSSRELSDLRGNRIAMVFQEPATSFDPLFSVGDQLIETILRHEDIDRPSAHERAVRLLERVHMPHARLRMKQIPQELSGGMLQRAMIAMALAGNPDLLIADEPTTALDVTIQAQILGLLKELQREDGLAILLITHDLGVAAEMADRVMVMYAGRVVEQAPAGELFADPRHPYTRGLLRSSVPTDSRRGSRLAAIPGAIPRLDQFPDGCRFHPRCPMSTERCRVETPPPVTFGRREVACWRAFEDEPPLATIAAVTALAAGDPLAGRASLTGATHGTDTKSLPLSPVPLIEATDVSKFFDGRRAIFWGGPRVHAVDHVSLAIQPGETFGLVGESGCGKSTLGRVLMQLEPVSSGAVRFEGRDLAHLSSAQRRLLRRDMQIIFQDPYGSIDPRWTVNDIIAEPLVACGRQPRASLRARVAELLALVGLDPAAGNRHAHEFSGGQRQRIGIARAIATNPKFILADEAVSALDLSIQAQIINLLSELKQRLGLTCLFIGHGLNVVRHLSDRVGVMYLGRLVEVAPADLLFRRPAHHYSRALIDAIPLPDPRRRWMFAAPIGELPSPAAPPSGCHFHPRCPAATARCRSEVPQLQELGDGRSVACHFPRLT
jgi:peptide/nickel transport system ATP-binding protein